MLPISAEYDQLEFVLILFRQQLYLKIYIIFNEFF